MTLAVSETCRAAEAETGRRSGTAFVAAATAMCVGWRVVALTTSEPMVTFSVHIAIAYEHRSRC